MNKPRFILRLYLSFFIVYSLARLRLAAKQQQLPPLSYLNGPFSVPLRVAAELW